MRSTKVHTVALLGGRFDPIHNGHLAVAKQILKVHAADEVWFSIENQHQWRPIVASGKDRKNMLQLGIESASSNTLRQKFTIDVTPIKLGGITETISVIRELRKTIIDDLVFVVGSDQLPTFPQWTHWEDLQQEVTFLIVARKGFPLENIPSNGIVVDDPNYIPLEDSATNIRERIKLGQSITGLVPRKVEEYIIEHGLYK